MRCVTGFCKTTKAGLGYDNNGHLCPGIAGVKRANIGDFHISMRWPFISLPGDAGQCHRVKMFFRKHSCQFHSRKSACRRWPISGSLACVFRFGHLLAIRLSRSRPSRPRHWPACKITLLTVVGDFWHDDDNDSKGFGR